MNKDSVSVSVKDSVSVSVSLESDHAQLQMFVINDSSYKRRHAVFGV